MSQSKFTTVHKPHRVLVTGKYILHVHKDLEDICIELSLVRRCEVVSFHDTVLCILGIPEWRRHLWLTRALHVQRG